MLVFFFSCIDAFRQPPRLNREILSFDVFHRFVFQEIRYHLDFSTIFGLPYILQSHSCIFCFPADANGHQPESSRVKTVPTRNDYVRREMKMNLSDNRRVSKWRRLQLWIAIFLLTAPREFARFHGVWRNKQCSLYTIWQL